MTTRVPHEHVFAEIAAFPFASEAAFRSPLCCLDPGLDAGTGRLWRDLEVHLAGRCAGRSLDLLVAMRDLAWFGSIPESRSAAELPRPQCLDVRGQVCVSLADVLADLAQRVLDDQGDRAAVKRSWDVGDGLGPLPAVVWRWLGFSLPEDLLLSALGGALPPGRVHPPPTLLQRRMLDDGAAEVHLHLGAAHSFRSLWASTLRALALDGSQGILAGMLESPGAVFSDGRLLAHWLLVAAMVRQLLAGLVDQPVATRRRGIVEYVRSLGLLGNSDRLDLLVVLGDLQRPAVAPTLGFAALQALYRRITGFSGVTPPLPRRLDMVQRHCDPVACFYPPVGDVTPEMRWLSRLLAARLDPVAELDAVAEQLFWQVVRLRCLYFQHVTQRPMTSGLQWFIRFYARMGRMRDPIKRVLVESAAEVDTCGRWRGLRSLEIRTSPEVEIDDLKQKVVTHLRSWCHARHRLWSAGERRPEFGLVFHFVKTRKGSWDMGRPQAVWRGTHAQPDLNGAKLRYQSYFYGRRREAMTLVDLFCQVPEVLWFVRGIDVATDELAVPSWLFAPLFRYVRSGAEAALATLASDERRPEPLRATAHCGEDYVHLLGGLRRIDETLRYLADRPGDRLGHAMALGEQPARWAEARTSVVMQAEDRLWDLVWEWDVRTRCGPLPPAGRVHWLERRIRDLSREIFLEDVDGDTLVALRGILFDELVSDALEPLQDALTALRQSTARRPVDLALEYLTDPELFERGQRPLRVDVTSSQEIESLEALSELVRNDACARGVVVEINPSSNLLIGDLLSLDEHPVLHLRPLEAEQNSVKPLRVAIGADDALTFATCLPGEYELMHQVLLRRSSNNTGVEQWLDQVRRDSLAARFTLYPPTDAIERVIHALSGGRHPGCPENAGHPMGSNACPGIS